MTCVRLLCLICIFSLSLAQHFYDPSPCDSEDGLYPGTRYACESFPSSCRTFLVYRVNQDFQTVKSISALFDKDVDDDFLIMNNVSSPSEILRSGRDVILPVSCSCSGGFFQANVSYEIQETITYSEIACGVFEGLVKAITVTQEKNSMKKGLQVGSVLSIPLRCACPHNLSKTQGFDYLVTYPLISKDDMSILSKKFNVSVNDIWNANNLQADSTVYPQTTVLVPLKGLPSINFSIFPDVEPPFPGFTLPNLGDSSSRNTQKKKYYVAGSVAGFAVLLSLFVVSGLYGRRSRKIKTENSCDLRPKSSLTTLSTPRTSSISCLSPDFLIGLKYSLVNFCEGELRKATRDFGLESKINEDVYRGVIDNLEVMIKELAFEDTRKIIDVHSKMNHVNILRLIGISYGKTVLSRTYLVFEYPSNGCLRDCLTASTFRLGWLKRTQIAFDLATGLHYLHYCKVPSLTHMSTNSRNIFLTSKWRAKVAVWGASCLRDEITDLENASSASHPEKADIFSFGMMLLELLSGKENTDGILLTEAIRLMGGEANEGGCFEQLRAFMDPLLKGDYPLAEALCLTVLAKACVEEDPLHRPSMDDIIKVLARMV